MTQLIYFCLGALFVLLAEHIVIPEQKKLEEGEQIANGQLKAYNDCLKLNPKSGEKFIVVSSGFYLGKIGIVDSYVNRLGFSALSLRMYDGHTQLFACNTVKRVGS